MKTLALAVLSLATLTSFAQSAAPQGASPQVNRQAAAQPASKAHILSNAEFDRLLANPQQLLIVDVRRPDEVSTVGGFPAYFSVQIGALEGSTAWIPKERTIVVVSNHAGRGARGADILTAKGFKVAGAIGAETYEQAGGKVVRIAAPKQAAVAEKK